MSMRVLKTRNVQTSPNVPRHGFYVVIMKQSEHGYLNSTCLYRSKLVNPSSCRVKQAQFLSHVAANFPIS